MRFVINTKDLGKEDVDFVKKGLKSYMELFDSNATVSLLKLSDMEMLTALNLVSKKVLDIDERLKQHCAIGNPLHAQNNDSVAEWG